MADANKSSTNRRIARLVNFAVFLFLALLQGIPTFVLPPGKMIQPDFLFQLFTVFRLAILVASFLWIVLQRKSYVEDLAFYKFLLSANDETAQEAAQGRSILETFATICVAGASLVVLIAYLAWSMIGGDKETPGAGSTHLVPVLLILVHWVGWFFAFTGIGLFFRRLFKLRLSCAQDLFWTFFTGWALALFALQAIHLVAPINRTVSLLILLFGLCAWGLQIKDLRNMAQRPTPSTLRYLLILVIAAVWFANSSVAPPLAGDSGLYHYPAIQWIKSNPIVPGLANLNSRFGFNNSSFLYVALLDRAFLADRAHFAANSLLLVVFFAQLLYGLFQGHRAKTVGTFQKVLIPICLIWLAGTTLTSPTPDYPLYPLGVVLFVQLISSIRHELSGSERTYRIASMALVAAIGATVKLSFAVLGLGAAICAYAFWLVSEHANAPGRIRTIVATAVCVVAPLLLWSVRGVILSGYPAYPSTMGAVDVEWKLPPQVAEAEKNWVVHYARNPSREMSQGNDGWAWLKPWFSRLVDKKSEVIVPLALALISVILLIRTSGRAPPDSGFRKLGAVLLVPVVALLFWFVTAPALRFAGALFWLIAATLLAMAATRLPQNSRIRWNRLVTAGVALISLFLFLHLFVDPYQNKGDSPLPQLKLQQQTSDSGLAYFTPIDKPQCWAAPIPCSPFPNPFLSLRKPGDLFSGFVRKHSPTP